MKGSIFFKAMPAWNGCNQMTFLTDLCRTTSLAMREPLPTTYLTSPTLTDRTFSPHHPDSTSDPRATPVCSGMFPGE